MKSLSMFFSGLMLVIMVMLMMILININIDYFPHNGNVRIWWPGVFVFFSGIIDLLFFDACLLCYFAFAFCLFRLFQQPSQLFKVFKRFSLSLLIINFLLLTIYVSASLLDLNQAWPQAMLHFILMLLCWLLYQISRKGKRLEEEAELTI